MSAALGVFFLASAATKQLHVAATPTSTLISSALPIPHGVAYVPRNFALSQQLRSSTDRHFTTHEDDIQLPKPVQSHATAVIGAVSLAFAGALSFFLRRTATSSGLTNAMFATAGSRPTMAETKLKFLTISDSSIPNMYNIPLQELLAQHHLIRYNTKYQYDPVFALGIVTVLSQLLEGLPKEENERIQAAYFASLDDQADQFKADAAALEEWATQKGKDLGLSSGDDATTEKLKALASRIASGDFQYTKFFSIGLFQLLQQSGQTDPEHFTTLVKEMNLDKERVTKDLKVYKDLLKRLEMAKDMKEKFLERERKKQQERQAQKGQAASPV